MVVGGPKQARLARERQAERISDCGFLRSHLIGIGHRASAAPDPDGMTPYCPARLHSLHDILTSGGPAKRAPMCTPFSVTPRSRLYDAGPETRKRRRKS